jgi:hypothetical protein
MAVDLLQPSVNLLFVTHCLYVFLPKLQVVTHHYLSHTVFTFSFQNNKWSLTYGHYGRTDVCRRPGYVPTAKCRGRRHRGLQLPATKLTVGTAGPSAQRTVHRRPPSAQPRPSAQLGGARRSPSAHLQPSVHALTGGPSR